jgi:hypothetical protein
MCNQSAPLSVIDFASSARRAKSDDNREGDTNDFKVLIDEVKVF